MKLTKAQKREYGLLIKHQTLYVYSEQRRKVMWNLVEKGLCEPTGNWYWFQIKQTVQVKQDDGQK